MFQRSNLNQSSFRISVSALALSVSMYGGACSSTTAFGTAAGSSGVTGVGAGGQANGSGGSAALGGGDSLGGAGSLSDVGGQSSNQNGGIGAGGAAGGGSGGSGGAAGPGSGGSIASGGSAGSAGLTASGGSAGAAGRPTHQEFILYDDSAGRLLYVNNVNPAADWTSNSGSGRDLQLVGGGRVMLGKSDGWDEYRLSDGVKVGGLHGFSGTQAAYRLASGVTMLASVAGTSIVLKLVDATGQVQSQITYPGFSYVRLVRPTAAGTYLIGADTEAFEGDAQGAVLWRVKVAGGRHTWKAMRLANGNTAITSGYGATLVIYDTAGKLLQTIGGKNQPNAAAIAPWFFADFHVLPSGNYFLANSQADRIMDNSIQLLEYAPDGTLVWQQKQPPGVHSVEEAIVLDGLDTSKLQVEPQGQLMPAP